MSGDDQLQGRRWPTRQRLVVLSFDTPEDAVRFDDGLQLLMESVRDVIDGFDDCAPYPHSDPLSELRSRVDAMRRALFELRQAAMSDA